jgi:hypothetical protein
MAVRGENLMLDFVWIAFAGLFGFFAAARDTDLAVFALPQPAKSPDSPSFRACIAVEQGLVSIESIASGHSRRAQGVAGVCRPTLRAPVTGQPRTLPNNF